MPDVHADPAAKTQVLTVPVADELFRGRRPRRPWGSIAMFLGPALCFYFAFIIYPVLVTFFNSFHLLRQDLGLTYEFVGLRHFIEILGSDEVFWRATLNSVVFVAVRSPLEVGLGFLLALLLNRRLVARSLLRTLFFVPVVMSLIVVTLIFQRGNIINKTEWDTAPIRVTPILLPFSSVGVLISLRAIIRCKPLLTTPAIITVSAPCNVEATRASPAEATT